MMKRGAHRRVQTGHPWVFSNEVEMDPAAKALAPGAIVTVTDAGGGGLGTAYFNSRTLIAARMLSPTMDTAIDAEFIGGRLRTALALRERLYSTPFYRLVHAEADGLPGLVIDRFGDVCVVQPNTAGMEALAEPIAVALRDVIGAKAVILRGESGARKLEGLPDEVRTLFGTIDTEIALEENGATFFANVTSGQKTGWFFDQRDNHAFIASLCKDRSVLDLYTHTGGFGIAAVRAGALQATLVDSSAPSLELATKAAKANKVTDRCTITRADVFEFLEQNRAHFDVIVADPPAFVKSRKEIKAGLQGYRKLARLCARATNPGGFIFIASCSHNAPLEEFTAAVARGIADANRTAKIIRTSGAAADHPVHPQLPESSYLKALTLALD